VAIKCAKDDLFAKVLVQKRSAVCTVMQNKFSGKNKEPKGTRSSFFTDEKVHWLSLTSLKIRFVTPLHDTTHVATGAGCLKPLVDGEEPQQRLN
jgi:hypothetical protein